MTLKIIVILLQLKTTPRPRVAKAAKMTTPANLLYKVIDADELTNLEDI